MIMRKNGGGKIFQKFNKMDIMLSEGGVNGGGDDNKVFVEIAPEINGCEFRYTVHIDSLAE